MIEKQRVMRMVKRLLEYKKYKKKFIESVIFYEFFFIHLDYVFNDYFQFILI